MLEYYKIEEWGTVVMTERDYTRTYDKWADYWYTDMSNAYRYRITGLEEPPLKKITKEEAEAFSGAYKT